MKRLLFCFSVFLLSHAANALTVVDGSDGQIDAKSVKEILSQVARYLRDPETAQVKQLQQLDGSIYCGRVNAKTLSGGYAGFRKFVVALGDKKLVVFQADRNDGQFETTALVLPVGNRGSPCSAE